MALYIKEYVKPATKTAAAGRFTTDGEDFVCYESKRGKPLFWIDANAKTYGNDFITTDGISVRDLQAQIIGGLPSVIDTGTF